MHFLKYLAGVGLVLTPIAAGAGHLDFPTVWTYDTGTFLESAAIAADINADGLDEILVAGREELIAVNGEGKELWRWRTKGRFMTYPSVLPRPDQPPLIFVADTQAQFSCIDGTGKECWRATLKGPSSWSATVVADLNNDGVPEVVQTDEPGTVWAFDALSGKMLWQAVVKGMPVSPAVGDLDGDGLGEVVVATGAGYVYAFNNDGKEAWSFERGGSSETWSTSAPVIFSVSDGSACVAAASSKGRFYCLDSQGKERWNAPIRGAASSTISTSDFDGDGRTDIFCVTQLGVIYRFDESGKKLWEIDMQGRCLAPGAILDVNDDGEKEYVLCTQDGHLMVLGNNGQFIYERQFDHRTINATPAFGRFTHEPARLRMAITGGEAGLLLCLDTPATPEAISDWPLYRGNAQNTGAWFGLKEDGLAPMTPENLSEEFLLTGEDLRFRVDMQEKVEKPLSAEAAVLGPDGTRQAARTRVVGKRGELRLPVQWLAAGTYRCTWSLVEEDGTRLCSGMREVMVQPFTNDRALCESAQEALNQAREAVAPILPGSVNALRGETNALVEKQEAVKPLQDQVLAGDLSASECAMGKSAELVKASRRAIRLAELVRQSAALGMGTSLLVFEGRTWESRAVDQQLPEQAVSTLPLARRVVPGEHDPVPLLLFNVTDQELHVRVRVEFSGEGLTAAIHHSVPAPEALGGTSWDPLPELGETDEVSVPSLGCHEVWVDVAAADTAQGEQTMTVHFDPPPESQVLNVPKTRVEVAYTVLPFAMAPPGSFRLCMWAAQEDGMWEDLLAHGNNVFLAPPPEAKYTADGTLGASDFSRLDAVLEKLRGHDVVVLLNGFPGVRGVVGEEGYRNDLRVYLDELVKHMAEAGLDTAHFALYPIDEPGGAGWNAVNQLVAFGKDVKAARPDVQIYMDGGGEQPMFQAMAEVVDIWTPSIFMLPEKSPVMEVVRASGKTLWSYNCAYPYSRPVGPNLKNTNIVAEYRNAALFALRYDAAGIGFWCYNHGEDPWTRVAMEYRVVYSGKDKPVTSRRWEAIREGVEDARILLALQHAAANKDNTLSEELRQRIELLAKVHLASMIDQSFEEMRVGLGRYVIDASNNDLTVSAFRESMLDCVAAIVNENSSTAQK
ncbi:MAG TPA: PQQ-binding-like beta-propeller repeat protein [Candidatus Hydrogenedentes bacterium]|nr:PQQ-binding-like beta-propeller repeat protein [Candidatus Hydrogenedentota bacterium]